MNYLRYFLVGGVAVFVTTVLFFVMHLLITHGLDEAPPAPPPLKNLDFVRLKEEVAQQEEEIELPDKVVPQEAPAAPDLDMPKSELSGASAIALKFDAPDMNAKPDISLGDGPTLGAAASDADVVPMVRVQPMYPPAAAQQRLEGWVILQFTISKMGSVKDAKVVKGQPPGVFEKAALRAIKKWKYKAKVVDGERVERPGIRVKLTFELESLNQ
ncbi:MAG: TonB family protein [Myxococcota bacterium]|nr:TonB family protein [Myxococcota bacterium]